VAALLAAFDDPERDRKYIAEYDCYASAWAEPYLGRRRQVGKQLYAMLGIAKGDEAAMHAQHRRNMSFFDAPVGMFFTIDRSLGRGSWLDCGMFIQNVMLSAEAAGLQTCPQAAFLRFHSVIRALLGWPETETLVCGMALGYRKEDARENALVTQRECVGSISRFFD
jgi:nitroreductase